MTLAPTELSLKTPQQNSRTNSLANSRTSNKQEDLRTQPTTRFTLQVQPPPKFYGLPKIYKVGTPLRPIVSSMGSITYGVAKELAGIICPLVGQSQHHLKNTQHFIQKIQQVTLQPGEVISSYDVKALFTSIPVDPGIIIVKQRLTQDPSLPQRTQMSIPQIALPFWSSALKTPTSSSRESIMNRFMV